MENQQNDDLKKNQDTFLQHYKDIIDHSRKEIEEVRTVYKWLSTLIAIIFVFGIFFTYKSSSDFKNETKEEIGNIRNTMKIDIQDNKQHIELFKKELINRVDRELGEQEIQKMIKARVNARIDEQAEFIIENQINSKISPKIIEANKNLKELDKELSILKKRNHLTLLADKAISNANRVALDELFKLEKEAVKGSLDQIAVDAELNRVLLAWSTMQRLIDIPGNESYDDSGITYSNLKTKEAINLLLTDKRWQVRRECAKLLNNKKEVDVVVALVATLKNDPDIEVVKHAILSFANLTGMPKQGFLLYNDVLSWWDKNKNEVLSVSGRSKPAT